MKAAVVENEEVVKDIFLLKLEKPINFAYKPGNFLMLKVNDLNEPLLRRPLSIASIDDTINIYYKKVGTGTTILSKIRVNDYIDFTGPFGNCFQINEDKKIAICGGGIGCAPLIGLKITLERKNIPHECFFGFTSKDDVFVDFGKIAVIDGSIGEKATAVELLEKYIDESYHVYACGPLPMLKKLSKSADNIGFSLDVSLESHMACGFGVCLGCSINTIYGYKQVCKDGPVFNYFEIIWQ